jgi:hypothetical protein
VQVTAVVADGDAQQPGIGVAGRCGVEGIDLLVEAFAQAVVGAADDERAVMLAESGQLRLGR